MKLHTGRWNMDFIVILHESFGTDFHLVCRVFFDKNYIVYLYCFCRTFLWNLDIYLCRILLPDTMKLFKRRLFWFIRHCFAHWPLDPTFRFVSVKIFFSDNSLVMSTFRLEDFVFLYYCRSSKHGWVIFNHGGIWL